MKLYHYSKELFDILKTRRKQGVCTKEEIEEGAAKATKFSMVGPYYDHISFYMDRPPLDILPKIFKGKHDFWINGNRIHEYIVDVDSLEKNILFYMTETPAKVKHMDTVEWPDDPTDEFLIKYFAEGLKQALKLGEVGRGREELKKQILKYVGKTRDYYIQASHRKDFDENIQKYAACVPHLMLYPSSGTIDIVSVSDLVVGQSYEQQSTTEQYTIKIDRPNYFGW